MQTFLPFPDFVRSAAVLDPPRLGKQRVENVQILRGLTVAGHGFRHHPAVKMWAGYEEALVRYGLIVASTWTATGRADTTAATLSTDLAASCGITTVRSVSTLRAAGDLPPWLGDDDFHRSHQSALIRKDAAFYGPVFGDVPPDLPYVWPSSDRPNGCNPP
jgi:hypothetical protein